MLKELIVCVLVGLVGVACNDDVAPSYDNDVMDEGNRGGADEPAKLTASSFGLELTLPFAADQSHTLTRAYAPVASDTVTWTHTGKDAYALDFALRGSNVRLLAAHDGEVIFAGWNDFGYGYQVLLRNENTGLVSRYAHMRQQPSVSVSQQVHQGDLIGLEGGTPNWGQHVHFALYQVASDGSYKPVLAEPLSGYTDMQSQVGHVIGNKLPNLPVGSLVKGADSPAIYLVCGEQRLCHYADIDAFRSRRPWHYGSYETAQVVNVSDGAIGCYSQSGEIAGKAQMKLVSCGASAYLTMSSSGTTRRRVPYSLTSVNAGVLLKSWGFNPSEAVAGQAECQYPLQDDLTLRPGTLIALASDNDFFVVTSPFYDGGLGHAGAMINVRRIKRFETVGGKKGQPFAPLLYGSYRNVLMIPDEAAFTMTAGKLGGAPDYGPLEASMCINTSFKGGSGGDDASTLVDPVPTTPSGLCTWHDHRCTADLSASQTCTMNFEGDTQLGTEWMTNPCSASEVCEPASGRCVAKPTAPEPVVPETTTPTPTVPEAWPTDAPHTVRCRVAADGLEVRVTGPATDALMARPTTPTSLQYGSDADGWTVPYQSGKSKATWSGDSAAMVLKLPATATHFNLYVEDASDASRDSWFDLNQRGDGTASWSVTGDCHLGVREILRGAAAAVETTPVPTSDPITTAPSVTPQAVPTADPPHTIRCAATDGGLRVMVTGPILGSGLMADPTAPSALMWGSDTVGGWSVPYQDGSGGRTLTPWQGDGQRHELLMPPGTNRFNLYVADAANSGQNSWFRLKAADGSPWTITGDCHLGVGLLLRNP
jgi:hypothetical protein